MVAAVSRALRELSEPCLGWTREPRGQPKSLGAGRQYSQATANNVLPVMTGSPAFLTRPPPVTCVRPALKSHAPFFPDRVTSWLSVYFTQLLTDLQTFLKCCGSLFHPLVCVVVLVRIPRRSSLDTMVAS